MANGSMENVLRHIRALAGERLATDADDGQLLERFAVRQEPAAFNALLGRHGPMVLGVCRRVLHHAQDAEDVFQATFLLLARKARTIRKRASVGSWLHSVAYRLAVQTKIREARRRARERQAADMRTTKPGFEAAWQELQALLDEELQRLPEKDRLTLVLCYLEGRTQEEAARQLGWPLGTVRSRLARARERLRKRLASRGLTMAAGPLALALAANTAATALPAALAHGTLEAALRIASGQAIAGAVSAHVATLLNAASKSLSVTRLKIATILLTGLCVLGAGAGVVAQRGSTGKPPEAQRAEGRESVAKKEEAKSENAKQPRTDRYGDPLPEGAIMRLGTVRLRHPGGHMITFAKDRRSLITAGFYAICLWDVSTGRKILNIEIKRDRWNRGSPTSIAISPDGKTLAAAIDNRLRMWDVITGNEQHPMGQDSVAATAIAFQVDGKGLAIATGKYIQLWNLARRQRICDFEFGGNISTLAFTPDGRGLAAAGDAESVVLWDIVSRQEAMRFRGHDRALDYLTFAADGETLAAAGTYSTCVWNVRTGKLPCHVKGYRGTVGSVALTLDGKTLIVGGSEAPVQLFDTATGKETRRL